MPAASTPSTTTQIFVFKRLRELLGLLVFQFIIGMALNTIGKPDSTTSHSVKVLWDSLLGIHIVVAFALLIGGSYLSIYCGRHYKKLSTPSTQAIVAVTLAFIFGSMTISGVVPSLMSYLMALSFLAALLLYVQTFRKL